MKRALLVALLLLGCSIPRELEWTPDLQLREHLVYLMDTDEPIAEVTAVDWSWYSGRVYKSYHVRILDKRFGHYEGAIVNHLSYPHRWTTEVHITY